MPKFITDGYEVVNSIISKETASLLSIEFEMIKKVICLENGFPENYEPANDEHLPNAFSWYSAYCFDSLSLLIQPKIEEIVGAKIYPRYTQARIYYNNSNLIKHVDKDGNEIGITINIDQDKNWDFFIENKDKKEVSINLEVGDACVFKGTDLYHWRNNFNGKRHVNAFLFYVYADGNYSHLKYDGRPYLGMHSKHKG